MRFNVVVNQDTIINDVTILLGAPRYTFNINAHMEVAGGGVENRSGQIPIFKVNRSLSFTREANAGNPSYQVAARGSLNFSGGKGPLSGYSLIVGAIINGGTVDAGLNELRVLRQYTAGAASLLLLQTDGPHTGKLTTPKATLAGDLLVIGHRALPAGFRRTLVDATTRVGTFGRFIPAGFSPNVIPQLVYSGGDVILVLAPRV
jgi:hypothetical protein